MTIYAVAIAGVTPSPEVYGGLPAALTYLGATFGPGPSAWIALGPDEQGKTLVTATRYLDEQPWNGTATGLAGGTATELAWPRSGVEVDGQPIDPTVVPPEIVQATFRLAVLIAAEPDLVAAPDTSSNVRAVNAGGGTGVEFFQPTSVATGTATRLPPSVQRLVGKFLGGGPGTAVAGYGEGGAARSQFGACHDQGRSWPD